MFVMRRCFFRLMLCLIGMSGHVHFLRDVVGYNQVHDYILLCVTTFCHGAVPEICLMWFSIACDWWIMSCDSIRVEVGVSRAFQFMMQVQPNRYAFELARAKILMADDKGLNEPPCSVVPHPDYEPWSRKFNPVTQQPYVPDCVGVCDLCELERSLWCFDCRNCTHVWVSCRSCGNQHHSPGHCSMDKHPPAVLAPCDVCGRDCEILPFPDCEGGVGCFCCFSYSPSHLCDECLHDHVSRLSPMYLD